MTTTYAIVSCPSCGAEVKLRFRKVEVDVDDYLHFGDGRREPINLRADIVAEGSHRCAMEADKQVTQN